MPRSSVRTLLTVLLALCLTAPMQADDPPKMVWVKAKCAVCHGGDGRGDTPNGKKMKLRDLRGDHVQKLSDADLANLIRTGHSRMPDFRRSLTDPQIKAIVSFLRSLVKPG